MFLKLFKTLRSFSSPKGVSPATVSMLKNDWKTIDQNLKLGTPTHLRQAVIVADKTLDNALKDLVKGETMGERLKNSRDLFDKKIYNKIWQAHKVRNSLVHDAGYEPTHFILKGAISDLRDGLKSLNVNL